MAGQNTFQILVLNDAKIIGEQVGNKNGNAFCPELTQILNLEETETH